MKGLLCAFGFIGLGIGSGFITAPLKAQTNPAVTPAGLEAQDTHASASLLGQFRTSLSAWMYFHADLYLHNGVEMRPLTEAETSHGARGVGGATDGHEALVNDDAIVTVVPGTEKDFRGVLGDMERATSAYKDMKGHQHNDPTATLPLFRLMTWLDSEFVPGWVMGGMVLARDTSDGGTEKCLKFLEEGLSFNPTSIDLLKEVGYIRLIHAKDPGRAIADLELARKEGQRQRLYIDADSKDALLETYRWLGMAYRNHRDSERMKVVTAEGLALFPNDGPLQRIHDGKAVNPKLFSVNGTE